LELNAKPLKLDQWPGPIMELYSGKETVERIMQSAKHSDSQKERERMCELYFYLGERALIQGDSTEAKKFFQAAIDTGVTHFYEYAGAEAELRRLGI
jgi:lipoprotein NlpI